MLEQCLDQVDNDLVLQPVIFEVDRLKYAFLLLYRNPADHLAHSPGSQLVMRQIDVLNAESEVAKYCSATLLTERVAGQVNCLGLVQVLHRRAKGKSVAFA